MTKYPVAGAHYLIEGFKLLLKPGIKRYVIIPLLINITLFVSLFLITRHFFVEFNTWLLHYLPHWLAWLNTILWILFFLGFLLMMSYTFVTLANIIAAPFHSFLAEKVEFYLTGNKQDQKFSDTLKDIPRIIARQFAILGFYLPRAILLCILFFIPIVQLFAAFFWFLFSRP